MMLHLMIFSMPLNYNEYRDDHRGSLFSRAPHVLVYENSAKDCFQDVFVSIWTKHEILRIENQHNYLHQAVRFRALRWLEQSRQATSLEAGLTRGMIQIVASDALECKELRTRIERRVSALPPDQQEIFLLHREQDLTYAQIAQEMKIFIKTVEKMMTLSSKSLRHINFLPP
jgi:RNA polymerase sigma-19 factor, ECF subfamily